MPIRGQGWEIHIERKSMQSRNYGKARQRTIGTYQVYHDGKRQPGLSGVTAERGGPGDNSTPGNGKRVEEGIYPLWTQDGTKYDTMGYHRSEATNVIPKPGIELMETGKRKEILIHPGQYFISSIGCINLATNLPHAGEPISYKGSRKRVIALIEDIKAFLGNDFPNKNGARIPRAWAVIDGEP